MIRNASFIHTAFVYSTIIVLMNWEGKCLHAMCRKHLSCYFYPEFGILARDVPLTPASCFKFTGLLLFKSMATQETLWHLDSMRSVESVEFSWKRPLFPSDLSDCESQNNVESLFLLRCMGCWSTSQQAALHRDWSKLTLRCFPGTTVNAGWREAACRPCNFKEPGQELKIFITPYKSDEII